MTTGYKPYPPTNNAQVAWVKGNVVAVQELVEVPMDSHAHRNGISLIIGKFLSMYLTAGQSDLKMAAQRQATIIQAFQDDLVRFPLWAIEDGLCAYRASSQGKWAPRVSGEVMDHIFAEYSKAKTTLKNCRRILTSDERGLNIDAMRAGLEATADEKARAELALTMMNRLEKACDIMVDPVGRDFYRTCSDTFHAWRVENAKKVAEADRGDEE